MKNNSVDSYWEKNPLIVKEFLEQQNNYILLCQEVSYILKQELRKNEIDFSSVAQRAKTLNSFIEKIQRKKYDNPFKEITDFSGVRVVFLYVSDYEKIEHLIKENFEIIEKVDKLNEKKVDQFGYGAIHFIIKLGSRYKGARYDDLNELVCEIQVRTILQDAWAVIDHHLVYKKEEDVPSHLRRKLNSLAGLFETADDQFERIKEERLDYIKELKEISLSPDKFLDLDVNIDSFQEFLEWKYDDKLPLNTFEDQLELIFKDIDKRRYKKLRDLDKVHSIAEKHYKKVAIELEKLNSSENESKVLDFALRMVIYDKNIRKKTGVPRLWKEALNNLAIEGNSKRPK